MKLIDQIMGSIGFCGKPPHVWENDPLCRAIRINASLYLPDVLDYYARCNWCSNEQVLAPTAISMELVHYCQMVAQEGEEHPYTLVATYRCCQAITRAHIQAYNLSEKDRHFFFEQKLYTLKDHYPRKTPSNFRIPVQ